MNIVFVGAGGSGVSALVQLMIDLSIPNIICIDSTDSVLMHKFHEAWIRTYIGHGTYTVQSGDLLIYSAATTESIEVKSAFENTLQNHLSPPPLLYAEFLWELSKYLYTIAISGTHWKSTTTGMVAAACIDHIPETTLAIIWAGVTQWEWKHCWYNNKKRTELRNIVLRITSRKATSLHIPTKELFFVIEADEFNHHFLFLEPDISIITSLDHDHVDIYPTRDSYLAAFNQFCTNTKHRVFTLSSICKELEPNKKIITTQPQTFDFTLIVWGHNHANASLAFDGVCFAAQDSDSKKSVEIKKSIEQFQWLQRRVELLWKNKYGTPIFSDYGHHPDEIKSTLHAFQEKYPSSAITCFFEAHQARRLLTFWDEFVEAFNWISCFVVPAYTAREDIESIQIYRQELPVNKALPTHIESFKNITDIFATQINGKTIHDRETLGSAVESIQEWSILCFSAWVLDSKLRSYIQNIK